MRGQPVTPQNEEGHRVHELIDHALAEAGNGPEKATPETGSVDLTLVTPDANNSDSH